MANTNCFHINENGEISTRLTMEQALAKANAGGYSWLTFCNPSFEELDKLSKPLKLHPLSIEDCIDDIQIPKFENYPDYTFILFNSFNYTNNTLGLEEVNFFIGANFLITVHHLPLADKQIIQHIENNIAKNQKVIKQGISFLMHIILDFIVDKKFGAIEAMEDELDKTEEAMLNDLPDFSLNKLQNLRRDLIALRKSLFHEREVLAKICRKDSPFILEKAIYHYRDIYDHLANFYELTETFREIVTSLMEMYLSLLNNKMARSANQTNFIMRRLTFITTIFMPLTLLAGIGGMSEWTMMTSPLNWKITYPLFIIGCVLIGIITYYLLKKVERQYK